LILASSASLTVDRGRAFVSWSKGKSKIVWLDGGEEVGNSCEAQSYHGFRGIDQKVVDLVSGFSK